jgi:excisionase family DNA binding protein
LTEEPRNEQDSPLIGLISTAEAAARFGYTQDHLGLLLRKRTISGKKIGRDWFIDENSLKQYVESNPKPGRPVS